MEDIKTYADTNTNTGTTLKRSFCSHGGGPVTIHTAFQPGSVFVPFRALNDMNLQSQMPLLKNFFEDRVAWVRQFAAK